MIIDNHVHIGWFKDGYHSPVEVWEGIRKTNISKIVVSSTSTCADLYHNILTEFYQLISIAGKNNIIPILWLTPKILLKNWALKKLLKSKIDWQGIKLHYISNPSFGENSNLVNKALSIARLLGDVPVLLHTGDWENCHAGVFETIIEENPDLKFILAHGRPIEETIKVLKMYSNAYTDTAFMPLDNINVLKKNELSQKVLFGSDIPINRVYFPQYSTNEFLKIRLNEIEGIDSKILNNTIF